MSNLDRWINLEGPEPRGIREVLDAVRDVPEPTPEEDAALTRAIHAAIAAQDRRDRRKRWALGGLALASAAAAAAAIGWFALRVPVDTEVADIGAPHTAVTPSANVPDAGPAPSAQRPAPEPSAAPGSKRPPR